MLNFERMEEAVRRLSATELKFLVEFGKRNEQRPLQRDNTYPYQSYQDVAEALGRARSTAKTQADNIILKLADVGVRDIDDLHELAEEWNRRHPIAVRKPVREPVQRPVREKRIRLQKSYYLLRRRTQLHVLRTTLQETEERLTALIETTESKRQQERVALDIAFKVNRQALMIVLLKRSLARAQEESSEVLASAQEALRAERAKNALLEAALAQQAQQRSSQPQAAPEATGLGHPHQVPDEGDEGIFWPGIVGGSVVGLLVLVLVLANWPFTNPAQTRATTPTLSATSSRTPGPSATPSNGIIANTPSTPTEMATATMTTTATPLPPTPSFTASSTAIPQPTSTNTPQPTSTAALPVLRFGSTVFGKGLSATVKGAPYCYNPRFYDGDIGIDIELRNTTNRPISFDIPSSSFFLREDTGKYYPSTSVSGGSVNDLASGQPVTITVLFGSLKWNEFKSDKRDFNMHSYVIGTSNAYPGLPNALWGEDVPHGTE